MVALNHLELKSPLLFFTSHVVLLLLFVLKTLSSGIISEHSTIVAYQCHADIDNVWVSVEI